MATASPLRFRSPATQRHHPHQQPIAISSSPSLQSPSTFIKLRASGLKSGSRAQQVSTGISGFSSAASLWRANDLDEPPTAADDPHARQGSATEPEGVNRTKKNKSNKEVEDVPGEAGATPQGKLVRPRKRQSKEVGLNNVNLDTNMLAPTTESRYFASETTHIEGNLGQSKSDHPEAQSPGINVSAYTFVESDEENRSRTKPLPAVNVQSRSTHRIEDDSTKLAASAYFSPGLPRRIEAKPPETAPSEPIRPGSIDMSVFTFGQADTRQVKDASASNTALKEVKKPRKRKVKLADGAIERPAKKTRKPRKKSESFILNSDDPDQDIAVTTSTRHANQECDLNPKVCAEHKRHANSRLDLDVVAQSTKSVDDNDEQAGFAARPIEKRPELDRSPHFANEDDHDLTAADAAVPEDRAKPLVLDEVPDQTIDTTTTASRRRLSWTPPKERSRIVDQDFADTAPVSPTETRQLSDLLGNFGYTSGSVAQPSEQPSVAKLSTTKRRKIELADASTNAAVSTKRSKKAAAKEPKPPKMPKQPKKPKKAQTITALATAAFQPVDHDSAPREADVSQFFVTTKDVDHAPPDPVVASADQPTKVKKPRKPRVKVIAADGTTVVNKKATKAAKTKAPNKAKTLQNDDRTKLYSPGRAVAELDKQDLLFGTSSQLAVDESPTHIRDMQIALHASEVVTRGIDTTDLRIQVASPPKWKSCVRVPSAPHGTNLSVGQADKHMWCETSRDFKGGLFRSYGQKLRKASVRPKSTITDPRTTAYADLSTETHALPEGLPSLEVTVREEAASVEAQRAEQPVSHQSKELQAAVGRVPKTKSNEVQEIINIPSDSVTGASPTSGADEVVSMLNHHELEALRLHSTHQVFRKVSPLRSPLRTLDSNVSMGLSTGRITKLSLDERLSPKDVFLAPTSGQSSAQLRAPPLKKPKEIMEPLERPRGRPRKLPPEMASLSAAGGVETAHVSASQPELWLDIDEIYDSDAPATPSPPRRRANSSPPVVTPLQLSPEGRVDIGDAALKIVAPSVKVTDSGWVDLRDDVFQRITHSVKSAPRSTNLERPSWWQKILCYDPIVLETFTEWLSGQGLRIGVQKLKVKPKKGGRKKKNDVEAVEQQPEYELVHEPLQAWMVQKWCEENSICCLWKGGLRGGVRTNY